VTERTLADAETDLALEKIHGRIDLVESEQKKQANDCLNQYAELSTGIKELKSIIKQAIITTLSTLIIVLGWSLASQWSANQASARDLKAEVEARAQLPIPATPQVPMPPPPIVLPDPIVLQPQRNHPKH
jgi:hypothetical protein